MPLRGESCAFSGGANLSKEGTADVNENLFQKMLDSRRMLWYSLFIS
ncbi:hypothetical protein HMPREF1153_0067 [Selenomonas sp. CM52]|nr:hypothetical protein HMPREF1153_0067 [Selenomonas sp. CM52]